ncbi:sugar-transfer associated ATP-grasp domain-containing protein [Thauera sp.]|uniref:sugar-transfer associated ATP-grasp domain-containing protein n=1 Tax=Thauera sp. TaxID=1905334 RepID=UPI0039E2EA04
MIEEIIEQHPVLAKLNPTSVNTLRIWVVVDSSGIHVAGAFLRKCWPTRSSWVQA